MSDLSVEIDAFEAVYPQSPGKLGLRVASPLFDRRRLIALAQSLAPHLVEYNNGDLPISIRPEEVARPSSPAEDVIERLGLENSWMTLRNIENDREYAALTDKIIAAVAASAQARTGPMLRREAFVFLSSPGAVTPFHFDEEHNILIQIEGEKDVTVYSQADRALASQRDLERFHAGGHRNLPLRDDKKNDGVRFTLRPGDALYIPPLAPHWVTVTGGAPALSLSVTWRSEATMRTAYLHQINHRLRARGLSPRFPGRAPVADQLKIWGQSALRRFGR